MNEHVTKPIAQMTAYELMIAVQAMAESVSKDAAEDSKARYLARLVIEQESRQRGAKIRIAEFFRQLKLHRESYSQRNVSPRDSIETVHADTFATRVDLRYSDIERLAPWVERDTKTPFWAEQANRLKAVLAANPSLTDKQKATLTHIATDGGRVSHSSKHGVSFGSLDGRTVNALKKRGMITHWVLSSGFSSSYMLIIAELPK